MPKRRTPYRVIQEHHISYEPEVTKRVFRIEHRILTWLSRIAKSKCSETFLEQCALFFDTKIGNTYSEEEMERMFEDNQRKKLARKKRAKKK